MNQFKGWRRRSSRHTPVTAPNPNAFAACSVEFTAPLPHHHLFDVTTDDDPVRRRVEGDCLAVSGCGRGAFVMESHGGRRGDGKGISGDPGTPDARPREAGR